MLVVWDCAHNGFMGMALVARRLRPLEAGSFCTVKTNFVIGTNISLLSNIVGKKLYVHPSICPAAERP